MKKVKRILPLFLALVMMLSTNLTAFASSSTNTLNANTYSEENGNVIVTDTGIFINGIYYSQEQFIQLLNTAQEIQTPQPFSAVAIVAGTWQIPGVGEVIITAAGVIIVGGAIIAAGSWIYDAVTSWFAARAEISEAKAKIPERLKDKSGNVRV